jgi:hypothetical protein
VEAALKGLAEREDGPFVVKLPRESGRRDSRFAHLFSGEVDIETLPTSDPKVPRSSSGSERLARLEQRVETLDGEIQELRVQLEQLLEAQR